jgi:hypothetical protein
MTRLSNKRLHSQISDLQTWLQRWGFDLKFHGNQYYTLLHECGHVYAFMNQDDWLTDMPLSKQKLTSSLDGRSERSNAFRVSQLAEEIDAWRIGRIIVDNLDHKINLNRYNKMYGDCVWSYVKGYTESKNKK